MVRNKKMYFRSKSCFTRMSEEGKKLERLGTKGGRATPKSRLSTKEQIYDVNLGRERNNLMKVFKDIINEAQVSST